MTSDYQELGRKMIPKRSKSYLAAAVCIILTTQQAKPKLTDHKEPVRAQLTNWSNLEIIYSVFMLIYLLYEKGLVLIKIALQSCHK